MSIDNQKDRYSPTEDDIIQAEKILKENIDSAMRKQKCFNSLINRNTLKKYKRQYVGFKTNNGDIIILINLLNDKSISLELSKDIITVNDGGENYWSVFVNITKRNIYGINVNGIS